MDISTVARAFGAIPEKENWDERCDLDNNDQINIIDLSIVALEYGKTK